MSTIKAVTFNKYTKPDGFVLADLPMPTIERPGDVLIKVYAASINPIDVKRAVGILRIFNPEKFPARIGYDLAGVIESVGADVAEFKIGDEVFVRLAEDERGAFQEYVVASSKTVALKPTNLTFEEAASLPLASLTSLQGLLAVKGGLKDKTVFVTAGLSGTGSAACQLAKNVFGAAKVITTVSTSKVARIPELLGEGVVDEVIDYKTTAAGKVIPKGSLDVIYDTVGEALSYLHLMKPGGWIISIITLPSGQNLKALFPSIPSWFSLMLDGIFKINHYRASRYRVNYDSVVLVPTKEQLLDLKQWAEEGKLKPVVGKVVKFSDFEGVKKAFTEIYGAKGLTGKTVIKIIE
ncbi:chaperonin 10-like protein [Lipomyces chichibuensis]|uniref:chaperonin 10-like protein n=1 Tax=Lipomyces chichibuensis TaxID=1546026 RepID=UPI003344387B